MNKKTILKRLTVSFILALVFLAGALWYGGRPPLRGGDFTLKFRDQNWQLSRHPKKLSLVYVGYAKCPDVCPLSLSFAAQSFHRLTQEELKNIQMIFISVDVENDTAKAVADYAAQFYPEFVGLSGEKVQIDQTIGQIGASYMVEKNPKSYLGYSIAHTDRIFFLNKKGEVVDTLPNPRSEEILTQKIRENL